MIERPGGAPIGVGIVGLGAEGSWAARSHLPALRALDGFEVTALGASSAESAAASGRVHGIPRTFGSAGDLARCDQVGLVVVTVKVPYHYELVTAALEAGKTVLCEWPLGNGLAEAEDLAARARGSGVRAMVGLQARSAPTVRYLADLVAEGFVGEVLSTTVVGSGGTWGGVVPTKRHRYLVDAANGATMLTIPFAHTLDGVTCVLGEFEDLRASLTTRRPLVRDVESGTDLAMDAADQIVVTGRLRGGVVANLHYRGGLSRATNLRWEINGTEGDLVLTAPTGHMQLAPLTLHGGRGQDKGVAVLPVPDRYHRVPGLRDQENGPAYAVAHAYRQLLDDLETGTAVVPDFEHAVRRHRTIETIVVSAGAGPR